MFRHLLASRETVQPTFNSRLLAVVAKTIYDALPASLTRSSDVIESVFPNLKYFLPEETVKRALSKIPVLSPQQADPPPPVKKTKKANIPLFTRSKSQSGTGIKVMINKWNDLIQ
jgi:hypothetical protein